MPDKNRPGYILWIIITVLFVGVAVAGYFLSFKDYFHKVDLQVSAVLKPSPSPSPSPTPETTPAEVISGFVTVEYTDNEAAFYQTLFNHEKEQLFSIENNKDHPITASLSPDGKTIIYADKDGNLNSYNIESKVSTTILKAVPYNATTNNIGQTSAYSRPVVSPDGSKVAFQTIGWEWSSIEFANIDGTGLVKISPVDSDAKNMHFSQLSWSPDSKKFAIAGINSDMTGESGGLYVASVSDPNNGKEVVPKEAGKDYPNQIKDVYDPVWSPDGSKIAFSYCYLDSTKADAENYREIYLVNSDGSDFHKITDNQSYSDTPFWSDNKTIVYSLSDFKNGSQKGIFSIQLDGSSNQELYSIFSNSSQIDSLASNGIFAAIRFGDRQNYYDWQSQTSPALKIVDLTNSNTLYTADSSLTSSNLVGWTKGE